MDAKKISDALGVMNLGKPPLAPAATGADNAARQSTRAEREKAAKINDRGERGETPKVGVQPSPRDVPTPRDKGRPPR